MVNKVGYLYSSSSNYKTKQAERELKREREERRQAELERQRNIHQETVMRGGVVLQTDQVKNLTPIKVKGPNGKNIDGFKVEFNNGMIVTYADQKDKNIRSDRYGEISAIFAKGSNISLYNVNVGALTGTSASENIELEACSLFNIDGNGGNDNYTSKQRRDISFNTYKMHIGDTYKKKDFEFYDVEDERDAATSETFVISDDIQHKERLQELKRIDAEMKEIAEAKKQKPIFDVKPVEPKTIDNTFRTQVNTRANEARKKLEGDKILQKAIDYLKEEMAKRAEKAMEKYEASLTKHTEETDNTEEIFD